jgi:glycosyl hydrolase family 26
VPKLQDDIVPSPVRAALDPPAPRMSRRAFLGMTSMGLVGTALSGLLATSGGGRAEAAVPPIALGAFAPSLPWGFQDIDAFADLVGTHPAIAHWFQDWDMGFDTEYMDAAVSRGQMPLVTWEPWRFWVKPDPLDQPGYALKRILVGDHDAYVRDWARAAARWGKPFFLRFAHEMNGDWTTWSPRVGGNTNREFVAVWRKVHGIFLQEGAANVKWVWSPVAHSEEHTPYSRVYPGDAYVDWFGISGYNWGTTHDWSRWQSFSGIFGTSYKAMQGIAPRKPIMIPEVGCAEQGGDKAGWIRSAYLKEIPERFPKIRAVCWFHANKETDWRVNSSPEALLAYKRAAASGLYARRLL